MSQRARWRRTSDLPEPGGPVRTRWRSHESSTAARCGAESAFRGTNQRGIPRRVGRGWGRMVSGLPFPPLLQRLLEERQRRAVLLAAQLALHLDLCREFQDAVRMRSDLVRDRRVRQVLEAPAVSDAPENVELAEPRLKQVMAGRAQALARGTELAAGGLDVHRI